MIKNAVILRGLPGSGKDQVALLLSQCYRYDPALGTLREPLSGIIQGFICSTDRYFMVNGEYRFTLEHLKNNHFLNLSLFSKGCEAQLPLMICNNTNTQKWEYEPYVEAARRHGYHIHMITLGNPKDPLHVEECYARNTHNVPLEIIQKMSDRFEI